MIRRHRRRRRCRIGPVLIGLARRLLRKLLPR